MGLSKRDRELTKIYFRARMMEENQWDTSAHTRLEPYEDLEGNTLKGLADVSQYKRDHIIKMLKEHPESIEIFKSVLHKIDPTKIDKHEGFHRADFTSVLKEQPQLVKYFDLNKLSVNSVNHVLQNNPSLISHVDQKIIDQFDYEQVGRLLFYHPELIKYLDITKIANDGRWIMTVLSKTPEYAKYLSNIEDQMQILDAAKLVEEHPELINHINFIKYGPSEIERYLTHDYYKDDGKALVRQQIKSHGKG